jgi:hypothetical protein
MNDIEATKFYIRHREGHPETEMMAYAQVGFYTLGVETAPFHWVDDIAAIEDLGPTVGIAGYIGDIHAGLIRAGKPIPPHNDYPEQLRRFLGREVRQTILEEVRGSTTPIFVKPVEHKAFTGFVWTGSVNDRRRVVTQHHDCPVWVSEVVDFVAEFRALHLYHRVIDVRRYKGSWSVAPDREIVEAGCEAFGKQAPKAYCLDWGVTADGRTLLVEKNDGFSFGHYGMPPVSYARMLSARWCEMLK